MNYSEMNQKLIERIYNEYGYDAMLEIWIEELLELATVLQQSKKFGKVKNSQIYEEIADVSFCLEQMVYCFDLMKILEEIKKKKARTEKRLFHTNETKNDTQKIPVYLPG